ncbi:phosphotransferase family protein [Caenibius tardaugens]|nr:phosphotransferase family protein [Caenibius tardaugens]
MTTPQPEDSARAEQAMLDALARWLMRQWPQAADVRCVFDGAPKNGMSNDTRFVTVRWQEGGIAQVARYVLRQGTSGDPIHPLQTDAVASSVELQYRVMHALLQEGSLPLARLLPFEPDRQWLGAPFFLMAFVAGWAPPDFPGFTEQGRIVAASADQRRRFNERGLSALARLHRIDWRAADLQWLDRAVADGPRMPAQLALWDNYCAPIFARTAFPVMASALTWLKAHAPDEPDAALVWGDARPQNMLWGDDFALTAVMDWEGAAILPPETDIAYWLVNDHMVHERLGVVRLDDYPTREEQLAFYCRELGRPVRDMGYYRVFALMTIAATMYNVYRILAEMGVAAGADADPENNYFARALARELAAAQGAQGLPLSGGEQA